MQDPAHGADLHILAGVIVHVVDKFVQHHGWVAIYNLLQISQLGYIKRLVGTTTSIGLLSHDIASCEK